MRSNGKYSISRSIHSIALLLGLIANTASANVRPSDGLWWQAGANGKFMQVHIGPDDYALVTLSFDAGLQPSYRVLQGPLQAIYSDSGPALVELRSPLYRIDGAGCLGCPGGGVTVTEDPGPYRLIFTSATRAELHRSNQQPVHYEFFPLLTRSSDLPANRFASKFAVLEHADSSMLVALGQPTTSSPCGSQFSTVESAYQLSILPGEDVAALSLPLQSTVLVVEEGHNPRARLLARVDMYEYRCVFASLGGCHRYEYVVVGNRCALAANLDLSGSRLNGIASPIDQGDLVPAVPLTGEVRLTVLE